MLKSGSQKYRRKLWRTPVDHIREILQEEKVIQIFLWRTGGQKTEFLAHPFTWCCCLWYRKKYNDIKQSDPRKQQSNWFLYGPIKKSNHQGLHVSLKRELKAQMVSLWYPINLGIQFLWDSEDKVLLNFYPDVSPNVCQGSWSSVSSHSSHPQPLPVHLSVPVGHLHRADQPTHLWLRAQTKHSGRMPPRLSRYGHQHVRSETTYWGVVTTL